MSVRVFDSRRRELVDLVPLQPGRVGIYVCGPTVQSAPHVGHLRSALAFDLWRRWLAHRGHEVTLVRNVTDIDDKILDAARAAGDPERWWALAYRVELEFTASYSAIGILPPTYEPRATANIEQMREIVERLVERGHAYPADDDSGDVYFDTGSWPEYGALTRQRREDMEAAADADPRGKRDPRDFALWKGHKPTEASSAAWPSPWGDGRPGWHIECSAMARRYLGDSFDIHGGGLDLRFPHHENELAQSAAAGLGFARHWLHNGLVTVDGQKMSKSLGNSVFATDLLGRARPLAVRYLLAAAHYRSTIDLHDGSLAEAETALGRIESFLDRADRAADGVAGEPPGAASEAVGPPAAFAEAMDDDLGVPQALAVLHETVRAGNAAIDAADATGTARAAAEVRAMLGVLGLDPAEQSAADAGAESAALGRLVEALLAQRSNARQERDWAAADAVRELLDSAGIQLEDSAEGTRWAVSE